MWIRCWNRLLTVIIVFLVVSCSKSTSSSMTPLDEGSTLTQSGEENPAQSSLGEVGTPDTPTPSTDTNPNGRNTLKPEEILKNISGFWSSTCRDMDSKKENTSEKDVLEINTDCGATLVIHTLHYSGSRSCEKNRFVGIEANTFELNDAQDGHGERNSALALDLVDPEIKTEKAQNILLVFANAENNNQKARVLFEILDTQRTTIRMQIQEWKQILPNRMKDQDVVVVELDGMVNTGAVTNRRTHYTKAQAFSPSSEEDLDLVE